METSEGVELQQNTTDVLLNWSKGAPKNTRAANAICTECLQVKGLTSTAGQQQNR